MDTKRVKDASQWFYDTIFEDEPILNRPPRPPKPEPPLPSLLRAARSLEGEAGQIWQSRQSIFLKQAKILANYEDDAPYVRPSTRYYPTYQSFTDEELRGYFAWRTKLRHGQVEKTALSFAYLYIYELLNQIGVDSPMDGYEKLKQFRECYGAMDEKILTYLDRWMEEYAVYNQLPPELLTQTQQILYDRHIAVLDALPGGDEQEIVQAVKVFAPSWLGRSRFYADHRQEMDTVIANVMRRLAEHYNSGRYKNTLAEQLFGRQMIFHSLLFENAVFSLPPVNQNKDYFLTPYCLYRCRRGQWTVQRFKPPQIPHRLLESLMRAIDASMRVKLGCGRPIQAKLDTKWMRTVIDKEIDALLLKQKAAQKPVLQLDYSLLSRIRQDADVTRDKLIVDEELEEEPSSFFPSDPPQAPEDSDPAPQDTGLSSHPLLNAEEYRLLQSLLYGYDLQWVRQQGLMLSLLTDSINEKLYDTFLDTVLSSDEPPEVLEDYTDELKEMIHP